MAKTSVARPSEVVLAARAARMYFLEDRSKVEIAGLLDISRFRVARLLDTARALGMVRIEIGLPGTLDAALSAELASAFGLRHAFVYNFGDDSDSSLRHRLGEAAGEAIADLAEATDVVGIAWSRSLSGLARSLTSFPPCPIVQMTGALSRPGDDDLLDLVRAVTRVGGGPSHGFYAPMIVDDAVTAQAIRRHPDVAAAYAMLSSVTIGMVGIGAWLPGLSSIYDALSQPDRDAVTAAGVQAEVSGVFLDANGTPRQTPLDERMIVTPAALLTQLPTVLAVAYGTAKCQAVWSALNGGVVNGLITHASLARSVLALSTPGSGLAGPRAGSG
ncbi:sugar-binding transcriptional regulator [Jatrophihabitans sp.]|jgi:DNA-binding transcriptional regulator LsrR (DeoR family)|uniref:sugar-binding transcriptional regulator n=1 Tax=Jatrophihabitans sp. TaxID=1932789 RepID=UPI002F017DD3